MDFANLIQTVAIYALPVLFAITVHEAAHGYVARYFGDNTAWMLGRVTLNPAKHIDPVGTILMGIAFYLLQGAGITEPFFIKMCQAGILVNVVMLVFNLFPLPPLDGGRVLVGLLPWKQAELVSRIEPWGFFIVMALVISRVITDLWMRPLMTLTYALLEIVLMPLAMLTR